MEVEVVFVIVSRYRTFEPETYYTLTDAEARMARIAELDPSGFERGFYWIARYEQ